jgi:hypothetical protein
MDKFTGILNKYVVYAIYAFLVMSMLNTCNGCKTDKEVTKVRRDLDSLSVGLEAFKKSVYTKEQQDIRTSIEGYEISKRMLYDQNAIVRTTVRPDDRMNEYDQKIKELREKLVK